MSGILAPLPGRETKLCVSLYADDAVIFANHDRQEIDTLLDTLNQLSEASNLCINPQKTLAAPI